MDNDAKRRPLYLGKILQERTDEEHFLTTAQLMQILEEEYGIKSHRQTIKSDLELLQSFGMDIQEIKSTQNRYNLVSRQFDIAELKLLIDAVESSKFITSRKSEELVAKLCSLASNHCAMELKRNLCVEGRIKPGNEKIFLIVDTINEAINRGKKIRFQYFRFDEHKEHKLRKDGKYFYISPLNLVWNGDYYYVIGVFDFTRTIGSFRVDRIAKCPEILDYDVTAPKEDFDLNTYINTTFRLYNSEHSQVELVCDNDMMDAIIDRFGEEVETHRHTADSFKAVVNVAVSHVFFSWVFGFGGKVKIKAPEDVRQRYIEMATQAVWSAQEEA